MLTGDQPVMTARPASYDTLSKFLHWSTALLLVAGYLVGENTSHRMAEGVGYGIHVSIGIAISPSTGGASISPRAKGSR